MKTIIITGTPYTENEIIKKVSEVKEKSPNNILILFPEVLNGQNYVLEHPQESGIDLMLYLIMLLKKIRIL